MKKCCKCKQEKPTSEFHRRSDKRRKDQWQPYCKLCKKANDAEYRLRNMDYFVQRAKRKRAEMYEWYNSLKAHPCTDCGNQYDPVAMHWDHMPGTQKIAAVSLLVSRGNRDAILREISKCELVCAVCHAIRTKGRQGLT